MPSIKFESAAVEAQRDNLADYKFKLHRAVEELHNELRYLFFETQKVIDRLQFNSPIRTDDDGSLGKVNYIIHYLPYKIKDVAQKRDKVYSKYLYWKEIALQYNKKCEELKAKLETWEKTASSLRSRYNSLPSAEWRTSWDEEGNMYNERYDPYESERNSLPGEVDYIYEEKIKPLERELNYNQGKFSTAAGNANTAKRDLDKLDDFISRGNKIIAQADKDARRLEKTFKSLSEIQESLKKYEEKLNKFVNGVNELIKKGQDVLGKALSSIGELKALSHKYMSDFNDSNLRVKFDLDDCKKYKVNGDRFNEEIENLNKGLVRLVDSLSEWNDGNKEQATEVILNHSVAIKGIINFFDREMEFLEKQISILTTYFNAGK